MRRSAIRTFVLMLLCVCMLSASVAEVITCPHCGYTWDTEAVEETATPTEEDIAPAEKEIPAEEPAETQYTDESSVVVSSEVTVSKGIVKITWEDPENNGPYTVYYDNGYGTGVEDWEYANYGITGKSFYFGKDYTPYLVPGRSYRIRVYNNEYESSYAVIEVPEITKNFESGKYTADTISSSIKMEYRAADTFDNDFKKLGTFKASSMKKNIEENGDVYKFTYALKFSYGKGKEFPYFATVTAPNGFAMCFDYSSYGIYVYKKGTWDCSSSYNYFNTLIDLFGEIPVGTYTVRLYMEGALANTNTFEVK